MIRVVEVVIILFSVLFCLTFFVSAVATLILIGHGKLTLPNTNARRLMNEKTQVEMARLDAEHQQLQLRSAQMLEARRAALTTGGTDEPFKTE